MVIKALIFDFDGLILETEEPIYQSWKELYGSFGFELPFSRWVSIVGTMENFFDPYKELERLAGKAIDWERVGPQRRAREHELIVSLPLRPGVEGYLQDARWLGLKVGLASSSSCQWVVGHLTRLGVIDYFDCLRGRDDVQVTKPAPDLFLSVLEEFGMRGDQAIVFEDSMNGLLAARGAGIYCVVVPNPMTEHLDFGLADLRLCSLADMRLEELLAKFN